MFDDFQCGQEFKHNAAIGRPSSTHSRGYATALKKPPYVVVNPHGVGVSADLLYGPCNLYF